MPLTFLSHQAPVLPLKIVAPRWFDGTALVVGSMAPDLFYATLGTGWHVGTHGSILGFLATVPLTLLLTWLINGVMAKPLGANLADLGSFRLKEFARLDGWRWPKTARGLAVLIVSALIGAATHVIVDAFTHGYGWGTQNVKFLQAVVYVLPGSPGRPVYVHDLAQVGATVVGAAITVWCIHHIGRRRLLEEWYPTVAVPEPDSGARRTLLAWAAGGIALGLVVAVPTVRFGGTLGFIMRGAGCSFAGLLLGCIHVRRRFYPTPDPEPNRAESLSGQRLRPP